MKRQNYISWDDYFMGVAALSAARSKDPNTQVGACIVSDDNKILSVGYNGMPIGCGDDIMPWDREGDYLDTKYPYVCHAELNAILNSRHDLKGSRIYVSLFPCNECAKAIIQSGIKEVIYLCDKYADTDGTKASKFMLQTAGVKTRMITPKHIVAVTESDSSRQDVTKADAVAILMKIIDSVAEEEQTEENTILKLFKMGFSGDVLIKLGFNMMSVSEAAEKWYETYKEDIQ